MKTATRKQKDPTASIAEKSSKTAKREIPVVVLEGDTVRRFNEAKDQIEAALKVIEALSPDLTDAGLRAVFQHNIANANTAQTQISSVRLQDDDSDRVEGEKAETVLFSWTVRPKKWTAAAVNTTFSNLKRVDGEKLVRSDYVDWEIGASFDAKEAFTDPKTGKFSMERYDAFNTVISGVAKQLNIDNPLEVTKTMQPQPDFFERRFKDFNLKSNLLLAEMLPTTTRLEPERPDEVEGEE